MALALARHGAMVAVHKHYSVEEWAAFVAAHPEAAAHVAVEDTMRVILVWSRSPGAVRRMSVRRTWRSRTNRF